MRKVGEVGMNNGEPLSGKWLTAWEHAMLIEEAKEQEQFSEFYAQIPELVIRHRTYESHIPLKFLTNDTLTQKEGDAMQPEAVPIPPYYGDQIQRPGNGAKRPITKTQHGQHSDLKRWCPSCKERLYRKTNKCQNCGQMIRW